MKITIETLKNPVVCFSGIRDYMYAVGEDFLDQNCSMFKVPTFLMWMCGKGYISYDVAEKAMYATEYIQELLMDCVLFKEQSLKDEMVAYCILAEYCSIFESHRRRLLNKLLDAGITEIRDEDLEEINVLIDDVVNDVEDSFNIDGYPYAEEYRYFKNLEIK